MKIKARKFETARDAAQFSSENRRWVAFTSSSGAFAAKKADFDAAVAAGARFTVVGFFCSAAGEKTLVSVPA